MRLHSYEVALFRAATLLAFLGAFRVSELVRAFKMDQSHSALQMDDVLVFEDWIIVHLRSSKADQMRDGKIISLGCCSILKLCPFRAMQDYKLMRGKVAGELLCHSDMSLLTKYQFWTVTSRALHNVGIVG